MDKWHEAISNDGSGQTATIDVHSWLNKATLDAYVQVSSAVFMCCTHWLKTSIGAGAFDYDFGAVENTNNKLTKSYTDLMYVSHTLLYQWHHCCCPKSFSAFGRVSKRDLFIWDCLWRAPFGFTTWIFERVKRPGMVNLRENRKYAHEVAARLIEDKRQQLKNGTSRKDLLSLLGSSYNPLANFFPCCNVQFFSKSEFRLEIRLAA